ncbi:alpha/beta hydrolase family protein [Flavobacterium ammonificans]|uniref:Alpha/beta hydrolase n=1 Tax=Flavobacterium ammonificans TaxID=1751056 RepID=A0ABM7UZV9_9FLAO|nr:alpha/beta hydrolase [Flavobacterium ammonificans]BDB53221.1 alpha/beta hydrolase [Flavobacterium ammonificans]
MTKKKNKKIDPLPIPKFIIRTGQFLNLISTKAVVLYAAKLFTTPIKHRIPKRELEMDTNSIQQLIPVPSINKSIMVYQYGKSDKKVLLVHGWSGRGTQLFKIADALLKEGYATVSFDAPAHGKSPGNSSIMLEFIASIFELDKQYGPFEVAIGHSLGGMAVLNAAKSGFKTDKIIVIGSGDIVHDIIDDFIKKLQLKPVISLKLRAHFENKFNEAMDNYSAFKAAEAIEKPILVVHDENDYEVPVKAGINIHQHVKNGELMITKGLGHRKILGDANVIYKIIEFIK